MVRVAFVINDICTRFADSKALQPKLIADVLFDITPVVFFRAGCERQQSGHDQHYKYEFFHVLTQFNGAI